MPFFFKKKKKQAMNPSDNANTKIKLQRKLYLAENNPDPIFDLSSCNLNEVPDSIFSLCKVLLKESLCLHDNKLSTLGDENIVDNLHFLKNLELQENKFRRLPSEIGFLSNLKVLNVSNNKLNSLPSSFSNLKSLHQLDISCNKLTEIPHVVCTLTKLQVLNASGNKIKVLQLNLSNLISLHQFFIDKELLVFPKPDVVDGGTEAIMQFLCNESGKEYFKPEVSLEKSVLLSEPSSSYYDLMEERRIQENAQRENELDQDEHFHAKLFADASEKNRKFLQESANENDKMEEEVSTMINNQEKSRKNLLKALDFVEKQWDSKIVDLLEQSEMRRNTDFIMQQIEEDQREIESLLEMKQENEKLRSQDVLNAMQLMVLADADIQQLYDSYGNINSLSPDTSYQEEENQELTHILKNREIGKKELIGELLKEEKYQREAFEKLMIKQDGHRNDIINQASIVQMELAGLSAVEAQQKKFVQKSAMDAIAEKRVKLANLLEQLIKEREKREENLRTQLKMLDERNSQEEENYWLKQYQRLMERKPKRLVRNLSLLDDRVENILTDASAEDFIPIFACKRITLDQLLDMDETDLMKLGISDAAIREQILKQTRLSHSEENILPSAPLANVEDGNAEGGIMPSAPQFEMSEVEKIWVEAECVICMDKKCEVVFLLCGHVCSCRECSLSVDYCPMCRNDISKRLPLIITS